MPKPKQLPVGYAISLHCQAVGSGRPVLLLHGLFGSDNNLGALARHLGGSYQTLRLGLRNFGRSGFSFKARRALTAVQLNSIINGFAP
jgi:esterase